jgi:small subunit ribosomal protein S6
LAEQRTYEVMFIVDSKTSEEDITRLNENLLQVITDQGGTVTKQENMGRRQLAYPIGRQTEGHYVLFEVDGSGREIAELERRMRVNDQVIRYITEKFKAKRARKASKRPSSGNASGRRGAPEPAAPDESYEA